MAALLNPIEHPFAYLAVYAACMDLPPLVGEGKRDIRRKVCDETLNCCIFALLNKEKL